MRLFHLVGRIQVTLDFLRIFFQLFVQTLQSLDCIVKTVAKFLQHFGVGVSACVRLAISADEFVRFLHYVPRSFEASQPACSRVQIS
jgi:hypothetical protein